MQVLADLFRKRKTHSKNINKFSKINFRTDFPGPRVSRKSLLLVFETNLFVKS
ncbi:hypothetical protein LEP1GSC016_4166 [Leptospira borgpetersenii serovar Hardjo-bovis str. Sponselee]|uniref:Uncharacterized protein n=7 Tax=Leptospira borgpetersenii TaxID=174 RepID=M3HJU8_LEPBO|nr:hypothetical protein LBBP_02132 [Leptospira borgpetersenii serovar Ballum]EKP14194.1 hypothetical protein LEP1GSC128_2836 [Leptospira borgpetersenii str. 200801926]EKQ90664.1 hypothetical protein LEP1GSC101_0682 [Leptospira borgpetersenii str. UI 09149]EKR00351.1 hypothetical protein LEP1GSC121_3771 [Leptospira borgpetersenii serovar Castellonis str. 200801910]EMF97934.1 hypothetical protein LEP1GSC123_4139 [Leptospira borgpetersenii str. 200701203]EMJ82566.1 hypothetical protein LEP1GSC016